MAAEGIVGCVFRDSVDGIARIGVDIVERTEVTGFVRDSADTHTRYITRNIG